MIMKKFLLLALPLMVMCFVSCEKDNGYDGNNGQKLVKEVSCIDIVDGIASEAYSTYYKYDSQNRVIQTTTSDGLLDDVAEYEYDGNTITISNKWLDSDGDWHRGGADKYYLDNNGYVIKHESIEFDGTAYSTTYEYENGYLTMSEYYTGAITEYEWQNGDIVRYDDESVDYLDIENKMNILVVDANPYEIPTSIKFPGTWSKHLISGFGTLDDWFTVTYKFDKDGYPTKIRVRGIDSAEYNIKYY